MSIIAKLIARGRGLKLNGRHLPFLVGSAAVAIVVPLVIFQAWAQTGPITITNGPLTAESSLGSEYRQVSWRTNIEGTSVVLYGQTEALGQSAKSILIGGPGEPDTEPLVIVHTVTLSELAVGTTYYYKVRSMAADGSQAESSILTFSTKSSEPLPPPVAPLTSVSVTQPSAGNWIVGTVDFIASTVGPADAVDFSIFDATGAGVKSISGTKSGDLQWNAPGVSLAAGKYTVKASAKGRDSVGAAASLVSLAVAFEVRLQEIKPPEEPTLPVEALKPPETVPPTTEAPKPPAPPPATNQPELEPNKLAPNQPAVPNPALPVEGSVGENALIAPPPAGEAVTPVPGEIMPPAAQLLSPEIQAAVNDFTAAYTATYGGGSVAPVAPTGGAPAGGPAPVTIDPLCAQYGIQPERCRIWREARFADQTCANLGLVTRESCERHLTDANGGVFPGCEDKTAEECQKVKDLSTLGYLPAEVKAKADQLIDDSRKEGVVPEIPELLATRPSVIEQAAWWASVASPGAETSPAVVVLDSDKDGLPDDFEKIIGTDSDNPDTDGDGVSDGDELKAGTDPLAANKAGQELKDTAKAIADHAPLEQPRGAGQEDSSLTAAVVAPVNQPAGETPADGQIPPGRGVTLRGKCAPNEVCLIYVYSYVPLVLTAKADENGDWTYDLGENVSDGQHTVYVAVTDETGQITRKSSPLALFVREAQAVTRGDFLRPEIAAQTEPMAEYGRYYLLAAGALILAAAGIAFLFLRRLGKRAA